MLTETEKTARCHKCGRWCVHSWLFVERAWRCFACAHKSIGLPPLPSRSQEQMRQAVQRRVEEAQR